MLITIGEEARTQRWNAYLDGRQIMLRVDAYLGAPEASLNEADLVGGTIIVLPSDAKDLPHSL